MMCRILKIGPRDAEHVTIAEAFEILLDEEARYDMSLDQSFVFESLEGYQKWAQKQK